MDSICYLSGRENMTLDLSYVIGTMALLWTAFQEYRINKICSNCPYFPPNQGKLPVQNPKINQNPVSEPQQ